MSTRSILTAWTIALLLHCCAITAAYTPVCGNGVLDRDIGEQCDDGNLNALDGCNADCQVWGSLQSV